MPRNAHDGTGDFAAPDVLAGHGNAVLDKVVPYATRLGQTAAVGDLQTANFRAAIRQEALRRRHVCNAFIQLHWLFRHSANLLAFRIGPAGPLQDEVDVAGGARSSTKLSICMN